MTSQLGSLDGESMLNEKARARQTAKTKLTKACNETLRVVDRHAAKLKLYPVQPTDRDQYVIRCARCKNVVLFCDEAPANPAGLSPLTCKSCGKIVPMVENRRKYDPQCVRLIDDEIKEAAGKPEVAPA